MIYLASLGQTQGESNMKKLFIMMLLSLTMIVLAACGGPQSPQEPGEEPQPAIVGTQWVLTSLRGSSPIAGSEVTLLFEQGSAGGSGGCNSYGAEYMRTDPNQLNFHTIIQTEMACMEPQGVMQQETDYLSTLSETSAYRVNGDTLELLNADGQTILTFARQA
jgi:heat shock protein HslJ